MIKIIKSHKIEMVALVAIAALYFILRLPNLTIQPIFADEAIYIRWAQVMKAEPTLRFLPLSDGKTPLFMWTMIPFFKLFDDPLFAGRFLSVISGFFTLLGVLFLGWRNFNPRVGLWSALLLTVVPFTLFFDRMALVDSMLAAFSIWSLNFGLLLVRYPRLDLAMFLGYILGGGFLTKTSAYFNIIALPFILVTFNWAREGRQGRLLRLFGLLVISLLVTLLIYNILRLGPGFSNLNARNQDYVFSPLELKTRPLDPFIPHLNDLKDWLPKLLSVPVLLLIAISVILAFLKKERVLVTIACWSLIPLIVQMFFLRTFTARYILFSIPPILCVAGWGIDYLSTKLGLRRVAVLIPALMLSIVPIYTDFQIIINPEKAVLPRSERRGYFEDWTAGYGFKEIANFLEKESTKEMVVVGTAGSFGTLPDGLQIYLDKNRQVAIMGGSATISADLREAARKHPTFYVSNKNRFYLASDVELIKQFDKPAGPDFPQDATLFFRVFPEK